MTQDASRPGGPGKMGRIGRAPRASRDGTKSSLPPGNRPPHHTRSEEDQELGLDTRPSRLLEQISESGQVAKERDFADVAGDVVLEDPADDRGVPIVHRNLRRYIFRVDRRILTSLDADNLT